MTDKKELRSLIRARKKECPIEERIRRSAAVIRLLRECPEYREARRVLCYWSLPDEVFTHDFVVEEAEGGKSIFLPVVNGDDLIIREFAGVSDLRDGEGYSIPEPSTAAAETGIETIDLVVVPGVAFDGSGARMGRGKGFYDRLLRGSDVKKIGICFDFQLVDAVPVEPHDIMMDKVVCESRVY